ncbi:hypothetical protein [Dysgonomonas sp. HGC4]|uniref:hypothetical protein n=1 Tax=Dysgonomonas sp. HGC4 TaxID=1658009 RepID=UPI0006817029|nr:hypothetical protein [Dysgonomonas sp. HGC4]MBD8348593.1 hypothetical protein [Dysgonomonas sp. HGC4]
MIQPLLNLYKLFEENKEEFEKYDLESHFFIDLYRSQPEEPDQYEYFSLPAIFVDYQLVGQGRNKPRLVTMILHVVTDEMPDASNVMIEHASGLKRFLYHTIIQELLEGTRLGNTSRLEFVNEAIVDTQVVNYHNQSYTFEAYLQDLTGTPEEIEYGIIELIRLQGQLVKEIE